MAPAPPRHGPVFATARGRVAAVAVTVVVVSILIAYLRNPFGVPAAALFGATATCVVVLGVWPHVVGARPRWVWGVLTGASGLVLVANALRFSGLHIGVAAVSDLVFVVAYSVYVAWLVVMNGRINGWPVAVKSLIDTLAGTVGMFLVLWALAGVRGQGLTAGSALNVVFPLIGVVAQLQTWYLAVRARRRAGVWWWVLAAASLQVVLDSLYFLAGLDGDHAWQNALYAGYFVVYALLASAVTLGSVRGVDAADAHPRPGGEVVGTWSVLVLVGVVLALVSLVMPGRVDPYEFVRSALVAVLLITLFARVLVSLRDARRAEADSRHRASHDPLTGVYNRFSFAEEVWRRFSTAAGEPGRVVAVVVDIDGFGRFNDTWGHRAGDVLLGCAAETLQRAAGAEAVVARYGGDEFVTVAAVDDDAAANDLLRRIREGLAAPVRIPPRHEETTSASVGVCSGVIRGGGDVDDLLRRADAALTEAKREGGGGCVVYDADVASRLERRAEMTDALRAAVMGGGISVAFQPIHGGEGFASLRGWEALARWEHPVWGSVSPAEFIPLAEETGLICDLGEGVLRRSLSEFAAMRAALRRDDLVLSVNVSAAQLHLTQFRRTVLDAIDAAGVPVSAVQLEVTESLLVGDDAPPMETLYALRGDGVGIALDDFGTGYASFTTLRRLPLTCVKVDRTLVCGLGEDADAPAQVRAVLDLVRSLHIPKIVAEGVETEEQARLLEELGCPSVQGWRFGRPVPSARILAEAAGPSPASGGVVVAQGAAAARVARAVEGTRVVGEEARPRDDASRSASDRGAGLR